MYTNLTEKQKKILLFIESYIKENGYPPSYREIASHSGITTPRGVQKHLIALEKKGFLKLERGKARGIRIIRKLTGFPFIGISSAGFPINSENISIETYDIDPKLAGTENGFIIRVSGESLINAGIYDGDLILISGEKPPREGDIVLARVNGEVTLKILKKAKDRVLLKAANPEYPDIEITDNDTLEIIGKAILVIRKL